MEHDKTFRGNASQLIVAGELCRRGYSAVVTLGTTPNADILCSNIAEYLNRWNLIETQML